jgi:hypothetical protein
MSSESGLRRAVFFRFYEREVLPEPEGARRGKEAA